MHSVTALLLMTLSFSALAQDADNPETLTERSQASARAVLDRAVDAMGGAAALRSIASIRYRTEGLTWRRLQSTTPSPPFEAGTQHETVLVELATGRMRIDERDLMAGEAVDSTFIIKDGVAVNHNHRSRVVAPLSPTGSRYYGLRRWRVPQLLLRQALDNAGTLRYLGRDDFAGKPHEVITFIVPQGEQVSLYVDVATSLVAKSEVSLLDPLAGDDVSEVVFGDYARTGAHLAPRTLVERDAGATTGKFQLQTEINPAVSDASFVVPHEGYVSAEMQPPLTEQVQPLAEGVFALRNFALPNFQSLAIAFKDHVVVVEAPGSSAGAEKLIARIKQTIPGKPIRYVVMTHHHGDHSGGLRSFIAEGATVITTAGNREYVEALARAPQLDRLREQPRTLELLLVKNGKHVLSDGSRTLELIDIGPNPHAQEMLVAYLPKERMLMEADVFSMPYTPRPLRPLQDTTVSFVKRIRELGLKVDRIVPVHGPTATASEFTALTGEQL
jgi:glyoxylase-like metal-dependent hydrolase (beta-lactamase superfamily II)